VAEVGSGWLHTVRRVLEAIAASDVAEFRLEQAEFAMRLKRRVGVRSAIAAAEPESPSGVQVVAPFTGIFYRAASPTGEPYAREGDWVETGTTVGLIETMKVFNEVKTEQAGRVARILAQNGQLVHAGEPLVVIEPGERPMEGEARI
jgi:biotin carboxyl carrier protein